MQWAAWQLCPMVRATANVGARKGVGHQCPHHTGHWVHTLEPWAEDTELSRSRRMSEKHEWVYCNLHELYLTFDNGGV